jgi:hypothetical protein
VTDINVTKFPIIIVANFRTGSTALGQYLANKYNLPFFSEPFNNENTCHIDFHKMQFIKQIMNDKKNMVLKFMPLQMGDFSPYEEIMNEPAFTIRLKRKNIVDQVASFYVSEKTEKYFKYKSDQNKKFTIDIDHKFLLKRTHIILKNEFLINSMPYNIDLTLTYEDLGFIEGTQHVLSDQPDNIQEIKEEIEKILRWRWSSLKQHLVQSERFELSTPTTSR